MKRKRTNCQRCFLMFVALLFAFALNTEAHAVMSPGLEFELKFTPKPITFPESYKEKYPPLYQAHLKLISFPERLAKLEKEKLDTYEKIVAKDRSDLLTLKKAEASKEEYEAKIEALQQEWATYRQAYKVLANNHLLKRADPYVLLFCAQQLYAVKDKQAESVEEVRKKALAGKAREAAKSKTEAERGEKAEEAKEPTAKVTMIEEQAPDADAGGAPSIAVRKEYQTNLDHLIAYLEEIRISFKDFKHMDRVLLLLSVAKFDKGKKEDAYDLWQEFVKTYPNHEDLNQVYFRMGEYEFYTPTSFDHFTKAAQYYEKAQKRYKPGRAYYRVLYKRAWATYLSPDLNADALNHFVFLYREMQKADRMTEEMLAIKSEILEIVKKIKSDVANPYDSWR